MNYTTLSQRIETAGHGLCVGLDPDPAKLPAGTDLASFCIGIIDATVHVAIAYKPNFAFFERWGAAGFAWLEETVLYIGDEHIKIADAKRGDIGNTSSLYARAFFDHFDL